MSWFKKFRKPAAKKAWPPSKIIHLTKDNMWGHRISLDKRIEGNEFWHCNGHFTPYVKEGDVFAAEMNSGKVGVFRLLKVRPCDDPRDMFFAEAHPLGYADECPEFFDDFDGVDTDTGEMQVRMV